MLQRHHCSPANQAFVWQHLASSYALVHLGVWLSLYLFIFNIQYHLCCGAKKKTWPEDNGLVKILLYLNLDKMSMKSRKIYPTIM